MVSPAGLSLPAANANSNFYKGMSNGSRSWSVGHFPSPAKVRSVATYATISLANAEERPSYIKTLQDTHGRQSVYLDVRQPCPL